MAPSTNTTRPRTGSLSLRNNPTLHNYYNHNSGGGGHQNNNPQQQYYQSLTRQNKQRGIETSGIEKSYHSITNVLKGGIASFDSSLDSKSSRGDSRSSLGGSRGNGLESSRDSSRGSSMGSYSTRGGHSEGQRSNQQHYSGHQQQARSSMEKTPMTSNRHTTNHTTTTTNGARASTSSTSSSTAYNHHGSGGVESMPSYEGGGVQSIPSYAPSTLESVPSFATSNGDERRQSLREIKAVLREEKLRNTLSFADSAESGLESAEGEESVEGGEESVDEMERLLRGGMESVPSFASTSTREGGVGSVPSFGTTMEEGGASLRDGSMESRNTNSSSSLRRMEGDKTSESGGVGQLCTVQESTTAAAGGGGVDDHKMMMFNQPSRESLDTFRHEDTSTFTNNNNTSRKSSGLYSANLSKERESLDTFKKTCKKGVSKMSQASFGKIRDILAGEGHHHHNGGGHVNNMAAAAAARRTSNTHAVGGYRESGIGLGGILQFGRSNSDDEEMSFFVSDGDGKVHKEKVTLVNEDEAGLNGGGQKMLLLEQAKFQHGETMKVTNVSRGVEEMKNKKPTVSFQQQQQRSVFHMKKDEHKMTTTTTTAPQSPIPPSGNTPPLVRSVKKATKAVSHSMKHEVVPATKAMAALTVKLVERGEKKMKDGVAPKLRAVALDIDSRLNHHQRHNDGNNNGGGFVGLKHIEGKGDYVCDPNYQVVRTPQHIDPQTGRRAYGPNAVAAGHNFDPNTPACLLGALTAGTMFNYDITHPEHPEYLPEGIPRVLEVAEDWEERAGFVPAAKALVERRVGGPVDLDEEIEEDDDESVRVEEMLALQQAVVMSHVNEVAEEVEEEEEVTDEEDARNASMWVAYNPEEDMEEEDEIMNVGEIVVATGGEFGGEDNEFSPRSLETSDSNTYHLGDLSLGAKSVHGEKQQKEETAIVTFQQDQQVHVETFEDDNCESEDEAADNRPAAEHYAETPMKKVTYDEAHLRHGETPSQQQQFTDKKKEFQTPFSVKKGERPLTFDEFRAMNRRVLFDNEEQAQPTQAMVNVDIGRNSEIEEQPQRQMTVEKFVSASSRYEQSGHRQRELKGRVVMIRIKKKISKAVKKALKQILLTAKVGGTRTSSNKSISDANFVITIPRVDASAVPDSPSAVSIASSLLSAAISESSKRVIGAAPFSNNPNAAPDYLYGAVNYHNRTSENGSDDDDESEHVPPPPKMTSNHASDHDDEDVVSFLAEAMNQGLNIDEVLAIEDGQEGAEEEEQMYLVLTPSEGGDEKVTQVISGKVDGTPVVFNEIMHKNEEGSEIKPHNLSIMFDSGKKETNKNSIQIMDAVEVGGNIVLTPTESNQNVGNVFRRSSTGEASASILQSSTCESEDETLVTHDGNTLVRSDTKDSHDHTITTTTSLKVEEKKPFSTFEIAREEDPRDARSSPTRPAYSHQAASNASFLFSPNNMGRADPKIRAKERAMMRNQSHGGSITMLPSASSMDKSEQQLVLKPKPSYSFDYSAGGDAKYDPAPSVASEVFVEEPDTPSTITTAEKKPVMASMTKDRQFSFQTILNKFSTDPLDSNDHVPRMIEQKHFASPGPGVDFGSSESQSKTPVVTNAVRKKYAATPFTQADGATPSKSPSNSSISSKSRRKPSPMGKALPKSAAKTRTGLVKDRISMFQQRVETSAVTGVNGRLKKNHSYRLKNERRETNGGGALAPRKAVLQSSAFIRTVPIGISTSYSRDDASVDESPDKADAFVEQSCTRNDSFREDDDSVEKPDSYVKQYMNTSKVNEKAASFGRSSLDSSSCVSEATECDAFNSLLGKFDNDDSSVESDSSEETLATHKQKENVSMSPNVLPSTFKQGTLVKPNEINHNRTPLTAQKWRSLAATHGKSGKKLGLKK
eukprot:scaffold3698_cov107-Skeletonema_dohrnii-CCMP3373.AAC.5